MPTERWQRLEQLFVEAREQPPETRLDFLRHACGPDPALEQEARSLLEKSKSKGEESATVHSELGVVYYKLGMWEKAADEYSEALRMRRRRNDLRYSLGQAYAQLGRIKDAEQKYREILSLAPDDAEALKALQDLGKRY